MKMRVIVTGGAGFIGSHLVDALVMRGCEVLVLDNLSTGFRKFLNPRSKFRKIDIRDKKVVKIINRWQPEMVFNLAAQISAPLSGLKPHNDAEVNILGTINMLEGARLACVKRYIHISTGGLFSSEATVIPTDEAHMLVPPIPYCISKMAAEDYVKYYNQIHDLPISIVRPANIYGPRQNPYGASGVAAIFIERMLRNQAVRIDGDGDQTADYVYIDDFIQALLLIAGSEKAIGPYNIGTGKETSVNYFFNKLSEMIGYNLQPVRAPARIGEARRRALDSSKIKNELGWVPHMRLEKGLGLTINWFRVEQNLFWYNKFYRGLFRQIMKVRTRLPKIVIDTNNQLP